MYSQELLQLENSCTNYFTAHSTAAQEQSKVEMEKFSEDNNLLTKSKYVFENSFNPYTLLFVSKSVMKCFCDKFSTSTLTLEIVESYCLTIIIFLS
jgi:hypothetical protein